MRRLCALLAIVGLLSACAGGADLKDPPVPLGNFKLGHNIVVAPKVQKVPLSREATEEELTEALRTAIADRFDRYDGDRLYHFGVSIEAYNLAPPGIPVLLAPKSAMSVKITVWDDARGEKLNTPPKDITVLETFGSGVLVGSGYTMTAEEQLKNLSENVSKAIERFLVEQNEEQRWFESPSDEDAAAQPIVTE